MVYEMRKEFNMVPFVENELIFAMKKNIASRKYSIKRTTIYINSCNSGTIYIHHRVTIMISI
jgi:hypothetical protein